MILTLMFWAVGKVWAGLRCYSWRPSNWSSEVIQEHNHNSFDASTLILYWLDLVQFYFHVWIVLPKKGFLVQQFSSKSAKINSRYIYEEKQYKTTAYRWLWLHTVFEVTLWTCYNSMWTFLLPLMPVSVHGQRCSLLSILATIDFVMSLVKIHLLRLLDINFR